MGLIVSHFCRILDIPALGIVVSKKKIFFMLFFSYYKPIADPRGMVGRIYKGNYFPLLYTKYKSPVLRDFREEDFYGFPIVSLWALMTLGAKSVWTQGHDWQDLCRVPLNSVTY